MRPIGSINSYLIIKVGPHRVVAMVSALTMTPDPSRGRDPYDVAMAVERRLEATMVGRIEGNEFVPGLVGYPPLFAPVAVATRKDLTAIFRPGDGPRGATQLDGGAVAAPGTGFLVSANRP